MKGTQEQADGLHYWLLRAATELREQAKASREDVASAAKVQLHVVARFETGETKWPEKLDQLLDGYAAVAGLDSGRAVISHALALWSTSG